MKLLRPVIGLKVSRQFFNQKYAKQRPIAPHTRDFTRDLREKLQVTARTLIGSSLSLLPLQLVRVISLILGFRQLFENRSSRSLK